MGKELTTTELKPGGGIQIRTLDEAMRFAEQIANTDFAPKSFRGNAPAIMLAMQHGLELGLGPLQAVQNIASINGKPSIYGDAALALVKSAPDYEYVIETITGDGDNMAATCRAKSRKDPEETVCTFTVKDAKLAGLWGKQGPWTNYPKRMLQMRARGFALRDAFPHVLKGLITAEEAGDYPKPSRREEPRDVQPEPPADDAREQRKEANLAAIQRFADELEACETIADVDGLYNRFASWARLRTEDERGDVKHEGEELKQRIADVREDMKAAQHFDGVPDAPETLQA